MFEQKKENINLQDTNLKNEIESLADENVAIHTMQDDLNSLSGIFPKKSESINPPELEKIKDDNVNGEKSKNAQYFNPFLDKQPAFNQEKTADFTGKNNDSAKIAIKNEAPALNSSGNIPKQNLFSKRSILIAVISIVAVASFAGGYYFWISREVSIVDKNQGGENKQEEVKTEETKLEETSSEEIKNIESIPKYLSDKPNFLPIDTENPSYENFKSSMVQSALEIKNLGIKEPVEFILTNSERTPVYFSVFKTLSGIKLSDNLMKTLDNSFSLFVYHDSGNMRMALSIGVQDQARASSLIRAEESKLIMELAPLFFEGAPSPKGKVEFKDNNYKGVDIRYFNLTDNHSASIDYSFTNGKLIIGTSKNSMWAAIDKTLDGGK
jgi:hypothetical protein